MHFETHIYTRPEDKTPDLAILSGVGNEHEQVVDTKALLDQVHGELPLGKAERLALRHALGVAVATGPDGVRLPTSTTQEEEGRGLLKKESPHDQLTDDEVADWLGTHAATSLTVTRVGRSSDKRLSPGERLAAHVARSERAALVGGALARVLRKTLTPQ